MLVQYCTFANLDYGLIVDGQNLEIDNNTFTRIYYHSLRSSGAENVAITRNTFTVTLNKSALGGNRVIDDTNFDCESPTTIFKTAGI